MSFLDDFSVKASYRPAKPNSFNGLRIVNQKMFGSSYIHSVMSKSREFLFKGSIKFRYDQNFQTYLLQIKPDLCNAHLQINMQTWPLLTLLPMQVNGWLTKLLSFRVNSWLTKLLSFRVNSRLTKLLSIPVNSWLTKLISFRVNGWLTKLISFSVNRWLPKRLHIRPIHING